VTRGCAGITRRVTVERPDPPLSGPPAFPDTKAGGPEVCPDCGGTGRVGPESCAVCDGTGHLEEDPAGP